jgi:glucose/arabinose dehydrogenase
MTYRARRLPLLVFVVSVLACSGLSLVAVEVRAAAATPDLSQVHLALARVASGLANPVALAWRPGDSRLYVAEQPGRVRIVDNGVVKPGSVLTVSVATGGEQGLLGLTFSLDGTKLYVDYVDPQSHVRVVEYTMSGDTATNPRDLLSIDHPLANHNGGEVTIGPDGYLYIGTGDGGGAGDPGNNAQNVNVLLGKILRIDPTPSASLPYTIPPDNPFVGMANHREEIWMYGLRNPWRFSFDRANGDLYIADVGQSAYEEIDYALAGRRGTNWGWNLREGFHPYNGGAQPPGGVDPLFEAAHTDGYCAIIGGYVYRGAAISNLDGGYVYGDLCRGVLSGAVQSGGAVIHQQDFSVGVANLTTFGEDPAGELYIASLDGKVYRLVQPTISIGDKAMLEGNTPTRSMSLKVTLSQPATTNVTVNYAVSGNDAMGGLNANTGADFKSLSGTLVFKVGTNGKTPISKSIPVTLFGDTGVESDETLSVTLSNPQGGGYVLGRSVGTGTILNDDGYAGGSQVGIGDASIVEANSGMQNLTMPVSLSTKLATKVTVQYSVTPMSASRSGTASGGGDYGGKTSGTVTFPAGSALTNITLPIWPGLLPEPDENFRITLSSLTGTGVTMLRAIGTGTILAP